MVEKTLQMHIEDLKKAIIESILFYEIHIDEPRDESYNAGLFRAIEAVKETDYVTR